MTRIDLLRTIKAKVDYSSHAPYEKRFLKLSLKLKTVLRKPLVQKTFKKPTYNVYRITSNTYFRMKFDAVSHDHVFN